ncbi:alpha/beta fold hydrolase [Roseococcus sp. DSY-14]|uniref:alpha/beta fold hydrolase n=1 Tax=Roseococcus sp. DSY-14 TaxID=3369650 RepID=UPI00387B0BCA
MTRRAALLCLALLPACTPVTRGAGPPVGPARVEPGWSAPLPRAAPRLGWAFGTQPPLPRPAGPDPVAALVMPDGMRLPLRRWQPPGPPRFVALALHGLNDHGGNFLEDAGPILAAGGVLLHAMDHRGFGWTATRGFWPGTAAMVEDARTAVALLRAQHPGLPFFVLGESMGGAVALLADPPGVAGVILSAPAIWGGPYLSGLLRAPLGLAQRVVPAMAASAGVGGIAASDNRAALERFARDPLTLREIRVDVVGGMVGLMDAAVAALPELATRATPTLVMVGARDAVVPAAIARRALRDAGAPRVALYPEGWHLLLRDRLRNEVAADMLRFMESPATPLPAEARGAAWLAQAP